jgi:hypothetical protein
LSRNQVKDNLRATDEEHLLEIVDELRDAYEKDLAQMQGQSGRIRDDGDIKQYKYFVRAASTKAELCKEITERGYSRLCSVPSFAHGLVMASRIPRHYTHAEWFTVKKLNCMLDMHGAVGH